MIVGTPQGYCEPSLSLPFFALPYLIFVGFFFYFILSLLPSTIYYLFRAILQSNFQKLAYNLGDFVIFKVFRE
jgi:hypothetical protein